MKPLDFYNKYKKDAIECEKKVNIPFLFTLAQAALETGWGEYAPGNMFFGIKDTDGINGNEQLLITTEYSKKSDLKFPVIISKILDPIKKLWKYKVKDYFRKYNNPKDSFIDHSQFFIKNIRYKSCFNCGNDPRCFAKCVANNHYATDPDYYNKLNSIINTFEKFNI